MNRSEYESGTAMPVWVTPDRSCVVTPSRWVRLAIGVVLSAIFTLVILQYSLRYGRLLAGIKYDDVSYLADAMTRLHVLYLQGPWDLLAQYKEMPPHSPYATFVAMASYALLGVHDWAPYVSNGLIILLLLATVDGLAGGTRLGTRIGLALLALLTPVSGMTVMDFRPDALTGLLTAIAVLLLARRALDQAGRRHLLLSGASIGAALLVKPSVFPVTLALCGLAWVLAMARDWLVRRVPLRRLLGASGWIALATVVLALPHYLLAGRDAFLYIWGNNFGRNRDVWTLPGNAWAHWTYYSTGPGGRLMLGDMFWLLGGIFAAGLLVALVAGRRRQAMDLGIVAVVTAAAYAVPTINQVKQGFLALAFTFLLLLGALKVLAALCAGELLPGRGARIFGRVSLGATVLGATLLMQWPLQWGVPGDPMWSARRHSLDSVYTALCDTLEQPSAMVLIPMAGNVSGEALGYLSAKEDRIGWKFVAPAFARDLDEIVPLARVADLVIAADPDLAEVDQTMPVARLAAPVLAYLRADPQLELAQRIPVTEQGAGYYLFVRRSLLGKWAATDGLGPIEGPYPKSGLPQVRWGMAPTTRLVTAPLPTGNYRLMIQAQSLMEGQTASIFLDGQALGQESFANGPVRTLVYPVRLTEGKHTIEIRFGGQIPGGRRPLALLFRELRLEPDGD